MGDFAQPPKTIMGLVPEVCPGGEGGRAEVSKPKGAGNEAVPRGEEYFAPGARQFAVSRPDAHLSI